MADREITFGDAVREAMCEEMRRDGSVYLMGEDIGAYCGCFGVSKGMLAEFGPQRVRETPISETAFVGAAVGSAILGMRPIVEIMFSDFASVCFDQIINQMAKIHYMFAGKNKVPMVLRTPQGGGTGAAAQHSQCLEAMYAHVPGLKVVVPSTPYDAKGLLKTAIRDDNPVIFLETKLLYKTKGAVPEEEYLVPFGQADVKRPGKDVTVVTWGRCVQMCLDVAKKLEAEGKDVEVIDPRTLIPLDRQAIVDSVKKTHKLVVVHEAVKTGGFGGEIVSSIADSDAFFYLDAPIKRVGAMDCPIPFNPILEKYVLPNTDSIEAAIREVL